MYSYKLFVLLVLVVLLQEGNAKPKKEYYKRRFSRSSEESASNSDGPGPTPTPTSTPTPRVCDYNEARCFQLDVPDAIKPNIFIDVNGFQINPDTDPLGECIPACNANTACVAAIIADDETTGIRTCFLSMQTFDQLTVNSEITITVQEPCDEFNFFVIFDVLQCNI